jgi:hypothetical protein
MVVKLELQVNIFITLFLYIQLTAIVIFLLDHPAYDYQCFGNYCHGIANLMFFSHPIVLLLLYTIGKLANIEITQTPQFLITCAVEIVVGYFLIHLDNQIGICILLSVPGRTSTFSTKTTKIGHSGRDFTISGTG